MKTLEKYVLNLFNGLIVLFLAIMLVQVFGNVVLRYGFNSGITISEEVSRILFVWLTFLGAVVAMKEHAHLGIDSFIKRLPPAGKKICVVVTSLLLLGVCWLIFKGSLKQTIIGLQTEFPATGLPVAIQYAVGLVASVGIAIYLIRNIYVVISGKATEEDLVTVHGSLDEVEADGVSENKNGGKGEAK
jgi:TRAP-type C4-dicarboxylate transport system permease small subunit